MPAKIKHNFCRVCGTITDGEELCGRCKTLLDDGRYIIVECEDGSRHALTGRAILFNESPFKETDSRKRKRNNVVRMVHSQFIHLLDEQC